MHSLSASIVALALLIAPNTERADCGNVGDRYAAAVAKVIGASHSYETCVSAGAKPDAKPSDCAAEMQALDDAHDDFVDAVADAKTCH